MERKGRKEGGGKVREREITAIWEGGEGGEH